MLNVVIDAGGMPEALARTLSSLIPAIPEGVVREGWITDPAGRTEIRAIADVAGCEFMTGNPADAFASASAGGGWVLLLGSGVVLEEGWWREATDFLKFAEPASAAVFRHTDSRYGMVPRLADWLRRVAVFIPGVHTVHRAAILHADAPARFGAGAVAMPIRLRRQATPLRSRAVVQA